MAFLVVKGVFFWKKQLMGSRLLPFLRLVSFLAGLTLLLGLVLTAEEHMMNTKLAKFHMCAWLGINFRVKTSFVLLLRDVETSALKREARA